MDPKTFFLEDKYTKNLNYKINMTKSLGLFFLLVSANYIGNILGCKIQTLFKKNIIFKHILGFICLLFFITIITNDEYKDNNNKLVKKKFIDSVKDSIYIYIFFLLLTKTHIEITIFIIMCIFTIYSLSLIKEDYYKNNKIVKQRINYANYMLYNIIIITTIIGFIIYNLEKYYEYGKKGFCFLSKDKKNCFNYVKFLFGKTSCKENKL